MTEWLKHSKLKSKTAARMAAFVLVTALVIGQIGPFWSAHVNVQALSFVKQWMNVSLSSGTVNVRSTPAIAENVVDYLSDGHRLYVWTSEVNGANTWYLVTYMSGNYPRTGYISSTYVRASTTSADSTFEAYMTSQGFPESYKPYLRKLHALHPNWVFKAQDTNLDWDTVLTNESAAFRSLIPMTFNPSMRSTDPETYNSSANTWLNSDGSVITSAGWVMANRQILSFYMDPRNMLDSYRAFMFESLSFDSQIQNSTGVNSILGSTFMGNNASFAYNGGTVSYAQAFMDAAAASNVSPYHLAARSRQEVGNYSGSVTGTYSASYPRVYNYYNIGANDTGDPILNGLQWALLGSDRNSAYTTTDQTYLIPWQDTLDSNGNVTNALGRYRSIVGGAKYLGNAYINVGQDTLYLQKFDVIDDSTNGLYWHQYMTFIGAPYSESATLSSSYSSMSIIDNNFVFNIPIYDNMPDEAVPLPVGNGNVNNYLSSLKVNGISVSPSFSRSTLSGYSVTVPYTVTTADIQATTESQYAAVTLTGPGTLAVGNNSYTVTVQASYGNEPRTYSVDVIREQPADTVAPIITIGQYSTAPTNADVTVTAATNEGVLNASSYTFTENGSFTFSATDETGNVTTQVVTLTNIDKTAPAAPTAASTPAVATSSSVTVTPTFSTDSVVKQYRIGLTGEWTAYSTPVVLTANETVYFKAQDNAGNWSTEGAFIVANIDALAPDAPAATYAPEDPTKEPVTVSPSYSTDSALRQYKIGDDGEWVTFTAPFTIAANTTVYFRGQDSAGNYSPISELVIDNIDTAAPGTPTAFASILEETAQDVVITATYSADSAVKEFRIGLNGTWTGYTEPITVESNTTVYLRAQDDVGNWSITGSVVVANINKSVPAAPTALYTPLSVTDGAVTVLPSYSDDSITRWYRLGEVGTWLELTSAENSIEVTENMTVYLKGINRLNVESAVTSLVIDTIDTSSTPTPAATVSTAEVTNSPVIVTAVFSAGSIVQQYKIGAAGVWTSYIEPLSISENTLVSLRSQNLTSQMADAWSETYVVTIDNIDTVEPIITLSDYSTLVTRNNLTVSATTSEGTLNAASYTFSANGSFTFIATDAAGNETRQTVTISNIDKTAPATPTVSASVQTATNESVSLTALFDSESVVKQYKIGSNGTWTEYTQALVLSENSTVYFKAQDEAGNWSAEGSIVISNIDTTPPSAPTYAAAPTTATGGPIIITPTFSLDSAVREYRVGLNGTWTAYLTPISLASNDTVYFRGQDAVGNYSSESQFVVDYIDDTLPANTATTTETEPDTISVQLAAAIPEIEVVTVIVDPEVTTTPTTVAVSSSGGDDGGDDSAFVVQSTTYNISGNTITGLDPTANLNTVASLTSRISVPTGATLSVISPSGNQISATALIGTGYTIRVLTGTTLDASYTAIVYGDTNGDGSINITDVATLYKYVRSKQTLGTVYQLAGDTDRNTKVNITDVATAFKHVRNKLTIVQ